MKRRIYVGQYAGGGTCGVHVLLVDDETGEIEATGFAGGFPNTIWLAASADGRRLFATNRGHDSVAVFDIDSDTGRLSLAAISPLGGSWPRDFTVLPGERIALACLERAGEVRSFRYEKRTGRFTPLSHVFRTHRPVVAVACTACRV